MLDEVSFDLFGICMGFRVYVLIYRAYRSLEHGVGYGLGELFLRGLHERAVECATHFQLEGTFRTGGKHFLACRIYAFHCAGDHNLSRAVVVGGSHDIIDLGAESLNFLIGKREHGSHCRRTCLACFLHGVGAGRYELQTFLKREGSGGYESGELSEAVACHHVGLELIAHALGEDDAVQENRRLGDLCLLEVVFSAVEHEVGNAETEDFVSLVE